MSGISLEEENTVLRYRITCAINILRNAVDREKDSSNLEQLATIAANGIYWRDQSIKKLNDEFQKRAQESIRNINEHIEMMAAAYLKVTDIDPREVELVQQQEGTTIRWFLRERGKP